MPVSEYMALCLGHPRYGYYTSRDPIGAAGDFTTSPEVSQMFGEMIGLWLASVWCAAGRPGGVRLVELGPGRGTLMSDALRAAGPFGLPQAAELWFVETSPVLRAAQGERHPSAQWAERLEDVPGGPMLLVANEFVDALPIRQFIASPEGWRERMIGLRDGHLAWGLSPVLEGGPTAPAGTWTERSQAAEALADEINRRLQSGIGAALLIDYGYTAPRPAGWTLQALRAHAPTDPLERPGEADLTWLVDFAALARRFGELEVQLSDQGAFLAALGIGTRAQQLASAAPAHADNVADALERLTAANRMGTLFKALAVRSADLAPTPGFAVLETAPT